MVISKNITKEKMTLFNYQRQCIDDLLAERGESTFYTPNYNQEEKPLKDYIRYDRILDALREESLWHLEISVRSGKGKTKKLTPESLNLKKEQAEALKANAGQLGNIQVFKQLDGISYRIHCMRQKIMSNALNIGGIPVIPNSKIDEVYAQIGELQQLVEMCKGEISENYQLAFRDFLYRITDIINASDVPEDEYETIIREYARSFPSLRDILDQMRVIINGPYRIPSLLEDQQHDQQILANEMRKNMLEDIKSSFKELKTSLISTLLDCLGDIEKEAHQDKTASRKEAKKLLNKIDALVGKSDIITEHLLLDEDTNDLINLKGLIQEINYSTDQDSIQDAINKIRKEFSPQQRAEGTTFEESILENLDLSF